MVLVSVDQVLFRASREAKCGCVVSKKLFRLFSPNEYVRNYEEFDARVTLFEDRIEIIPHKFKLEPIKIPIKDIVLLEKKGDTDIFHDHACTTLISLKDGMGYRVYFTGNYLEKYNMEMNDIFFDLVDSEFQKVRQEWLTNKKELEQKRLEEKIGIFKDKIIEYLEPYQELTFERIAKDFQLEEQVVETEIGNLIKEGLVLGKLKPNGIAMQTPNTWSQEPVSINLPIQESKLRALNCPNCKAPLNACLPCKCDYCQSIVEDPNKTLLEGVRTSLEIVNPFHKGHLYQEMRGISSKLDELGKKMEGIVVNMDANQLLDYLKVEKKSPEKLLKRVFENMKRHNFTEQQVTDFILRLKMATWKNEKWSKALEKPWKEKIVNALKWGVKHVLDELIGMGIITVIEKFWN